MSVHDKGVDRANLQVFRMVSHATGGELSSNGVGDFGIIHHHEHGHGTSVMSPLFTERQLLSEPIPNCIQLWARKEASRYVGPTSLHQELATALDAARALLIR